MKRLNLGSSDRHFPGYTSVDRKFGKDMYSQPFGETTNDAIDFEVADLASSSWPWADSSIDHIIAYDIIEHLPNRVQTMNELWRILKPGAQVDIEVPDAARGCGQHQDPTHVSAWCRNSFQYYEDGSFAVQRFADSYGIKARFKIVGEVITVQCPDVVEPTWKIKVILQAVK